MKKLSQINQEIILQRCNLLAWDRSKTAKSLGISLKTLSNHLTKYRKNGETIINKREMKRLDVIGMATNQERLDYYDLKSWSYNYTLREELA